MIDADDSVKFVASFINWIKPYCWHKSVILLYHCIANIFKLKSPSITMFNMPLSTARPIEFSMSVNIKGSEIGGR